MSILTALLLLIISISCALLSMIKDKEQAFRLFYEACQIVDEIWETRLFSWIFPKLHYKFCQWSHRND